MRHPEAWRALATGEAALDAATDELLRWTSVGLHVLRTASRRTELGGHTVEAGDRVVVWTWAANHDPAAFDGPRELRLDRSPNRHLALGVGPHYCIGAPLAKAELGAIYRALLEQVDRLELAGEPEHNSSIINFGFDRLPVRFHAR
jgi:cytochrome P450